MASHAHALVGDVLALARVDEEDVARLEELVLDALERAQRQALLLAVTECETQAKSSQSAEVRVAIQQLAIRIAKLALASPRAVPIKGPRKVTR